MRLKAPPFYIEVERSAHCHHHASNLTAVKLAMVITSTNNPDCRQTESLEAGTAPTGTSARGT